MRVWIRVFGAVRISKSCWGCARGGTDSGLLLNFGHFGAQYCDDLSLVASGADSMGKKSVSCNFESLILAQRSSLLTNLLRFSY